MKISFCSQIKNRAWQLRQTLGENLALLEDTVHEFILVDFSSTDDIESVITLHLNNPRFKYIRIDSDIYDIAKAKNISMSLGIGDILVSLDCDNFITKHWLETILLHPTRITHNWSEVPRDGTCGRISCPTNLWKSLGGYREIFLGCGLHDEDFLLRANKALDSMVLPVSFVGNLPIKNTKHDTKAFTKEKDWNWPDICNENRLRQKEYDKRFIELKADLIGSEGGFTEFRPSKTTDHLKLTYELEFQDHFIFGKGGKLPGLCGGSKPRGGKPDRNGFSARLMWRDNGQAEVYLYHPDQIGKYGTSHLLDFQFIPNTKYKISQEFNHGVITTSIDDSMAFMIDCKHPNCNGYLMHIYRGGSTLDWSVPVSQFIMIDKITLDYL